MKMSRRFVVQVSRGVLAAVLAFAATWCAVYWVSAVLRRDVLAAWVEFGANLLSLFLSFCVAVAGAFLLGQLFRSRQLNWFVILNDALKRIARGDFSVSVPVDQGQPTPFHEVASNLNQMAESLQQLEDMRQEFISDVSHEIQSPLTSIAGFARALHDPDLSDAQRGEYLDIIEEESRRLSRLSDNLLKLTSLESKVQPTEPRSFRLDSQLRSIALTYEPQWSEKRIEVAADLEPLLITADEGMLSQVWGNLFHNAIKFTPGGGRIEVTLRAEEGKAVVRVADTGLGISAEDLPHVFDRFYKADKSRTVADGVGGSGLGLSIVSKIVSLHGGHVRAESLGVGQGSVFSVSLPAAQPCPLSRE